MKTDKAVVMELRGNKAVILQDDGSFVTVPNQDYETGQVILMKSHTANHTSRIVSWVATAAVFCLCATGVWAYATPYSYVSLDVNPSIEYTLNRFDRVLTVKATNEDGKTILETAQLKNMSHKTIDEAINATVDAIAKKGYFEGDDKGGIVIATSGKDLKKAEHLAEKLKKDVSDDLKDDDVEVESLSVGRERVEEARKLGVTPGKLNLVEKLRDSAQNPDSIDIEKWLEQPVKDIMKATKENRAAAKAEAKKDDEGKTPEQNQEEKQEQKQEQKQEHDADKVQKQEQKAESKALKDQNKAESKESKPGNGNQSANNGNKANK